MLSFQVNGRRKTPFAGKESIRGCEGTRFPWKLTWFLLQFRVFLRCPQASEAGSRSHIIQAEFAFSVPEQPTCPPATGMSSETHLITKPVWHCLPVGKDPNKVLLFLRIFIYLFIEKGEGREKERETSIGGCLSRTPYWGPGLQPRHVP